MSKETASNPKLIEPTIRTGAASSKKETIIAVLAGRSNDTHVCILRAYQTSGSILLFNIFAHQDTGWRTRSCSLPRGSRKKNRRDYTIPTALISLCDGGDSNSHASQRHPLKMVCLPIPPPSRVWDDSIRWPFS